MNGLKNCGVEDILIACVDGLSKFLHAIEAVYPQTEDRSVSSISFAIQQSSLPTRKLRSYTSLLDTASLTECHLMEIQSYS